MKNENIQLIEGEDFYFGEDGLLVLTELYHKRRGHCCTSGCTHCPYGIEQFDPLIPLELQLNDLGED